MKIVHIVSRRDNETGAVQPLIGFESLVDAAAWVYRKEDEEWAIMRRDMYANSNKGAISMFKYTVQHVNVYEPGEYK